MQEALEIDYFSQSLVHKVPKLVHFQFVLDAIFNKIGQLNDLFEMNFGCLEASIGELRVSESLAASGEHAG